MEGYIGKVENMRSSIIRVVSDIHGHFKRYSKIIKNAPPSIQTGDLGIGFLRLGGLKDGRPHLNPPHKKMIEAKARFIRGNHNNISVCKRHSQFITDGTVEDNIMYLGGAISIDRQWRTEGYDWWADEELSYQELQLMISIYENVKPEIMITHCAPQSVARALCQHLGLSYFDDKSRTAPALEQMFQLHSPRVWIFGHFHNHFDQIINGCRFICQPELGFLDLNTETFEIINKGQG